MRVMMAFLWVLEAAGHVLLSERIVDLVDGSVHDGRWSETWELGLSLVFEQFRLINHFMVEAHLEAIGKALHSAAIQLHMLETLQVIYCCVVQARSHG